MGTIDFQTAASGQSPEFGKKRPHSAAGFWAKLTDPDGAFRQITAGLLAEETGNIIKYLTACLPKEAMADIFANNNGSSSESLNDRLYTYLDRSFQTIFNRFPENEYVNRSSLLPGQSPQEIAELIHSFGGVDAFNTGSIEKKTSARTAVKNLELHAGNVLRQHYFSTAFPAGDNICKVVKYSFRDNPCKPGTVTDLRFCINIPDSDLISPVFYGLALAKYIISEKISEPLIYRINREIEAMAGRKNFNAAVFLEMIMESGADNEQRINISENPVITDILARGFDNAVITLIRLLDESNLGFQFMENLKDKNSMVIREYEETSEAPDEQYQISIMILDNAGIHEARKAYDERIYTFEKAVRHLGNLFEVLYRDSKSVFKVSDFNDLAMKNRSRVKKLFKTGYDEASFCITGNEWNNISFRSGNHYERGNALACLVRLRERINNMYKYLYPVERCVMEERLGLLEKEYICLSNMTDPSQLLPGLVIDLDITSIKRKRITLDAMAAVLNEFLRDLPETFQNTAVDAINTR
ncbi:MAG: hypothetical protein FWG89_11325 [Treponema sp.]|nr:hypothetical protein [Treponema sp.]